MKEPIDFLGYMSLHVIRLQEENRYGTAHVYHSAYRRLSGYWGDRRLEFRSITPAWLSSFQHFLRESGLQWNTISTYLRMIRAVYFRAVDEGIAPYHARLFHGVYTGTRVTVKRAIGEQPLRRLCTPVSGSPGLETARVTFLLLFMLRGIPFVDIAYLRRCDLDGDRLTYRRRKTGATLTVRVEPAAMELIRRLRNPDPSSPYLFPFILHPGRNEYGQYCNALRCFNYRLKQLSRLLGMPCCLSSYSARHSWATIANNHAYHYELIRDAMGHSSVKVTETYFKQADEGKIDAMNREIVGSLMVGS